MTLIITIDPSFLPLGAERAGFRPCLRCRPELAPGLALTDSPQVLAQHAARWLEHAARSGSTAPLGDIAARLGVSERHLRRVFHLAHGVTPMDYLSTQRLLLAKQLLTDTALPVTQVALASGHGSLRRFNAVFAQRYRMSPSALRKQAVAPRHGEPAAQVRLAYRPPYDIDGVLRFLALRALPGVESVDGSELRRTLRWTHQGKGRRGAGRQGAPGPDAQHDPARRRQPARAAQHRRGQHRTTC